MSAPRLSVTFDPRSAERLERLAGDDQGKADVIRDALVLEDIYRDVTSKGGRLIVQRPDGTSAEILRPSGPWGSGSGAPDIAGGYALPPGSNGERDRRELAARIVALLYSCIGSITSAKNRPDAADPKERAVHELVTANAALAVGELDAFLSLLAAGLEGSACIHLRSVGELATRIVLCREHPDLAVELYDSWEASWEKLARKHMPLLPELTKAGADMRKIEEQPKFKAAKKAIGERDSLLNDMEWAMWSKRTHGDIYALVQVAQNLAQRTDADIRKPIVREVPYDIMGNVLLSRGIGFGLMIAKHVIATFEIAVPVEVLKECIEKYALIQQRDEQARLARTTIGKVTFYSYVARNAVGEVCVGHEHPMVESAAACLNGIGGEVHELKDGVFTGTFWKYDKRDSRGMVYFRPADVPSPYSGNRRAGRGMNPDGQIP